MITKYQFHLPLDPEYQLAAVAVLQAFEQLVLSRKEQYVFHVEAERPYLSEFVQPVQPYISDPDVEFVFNVAAARKLATATNRHVTDAFGIMLGVDQPPRVPHLTPAKPATKDLLLLRVPEWPGRNEFLEFISINKQAAIVTQIDLVDCTPEIVADHRIVVGARSEWTYLARAYGQFVVEFYGDEKRSWLDKTGGYALLSGPVSGYTSSLVWRYVRDLL
jgi:hypothetical protein